ncbi:hypothetical protein HYV49_01750 [Candidatus Pacearchaeota archaeon]|nr:hypothetical protein [Candidatus Pacearchaeota archaeon]
MQITIQLGKKGITSGFLASVKNAFKNSDSVRITVLKNFCRDREKLKEINTSIINELGNKYTSKIVGYTIFIKKWRKAHSIGHRS